MTGGTSPGPFSDPCIIYKPLHTRGGLELYVTEVASAIDAPIYTAVHSVELPDGRDPSDVVEFESNDWAGRILRHLSLGGLEEVLVYENFRVPENHDAVITIGEPTKSVIHQPHQHRIHMLNMPPRWLFDLGPGRYDGSIPPIKWIKRFYQSYLRVHDVSTIARIDDFVVPSETIGRRLETYYDRKPTRIIYPPVDIDQYSFRSRDGFLLYVGRLAEAKRVNEIVEAISGTDYRLKIAGTGPLEEPLRQGADDNVKFLGFVPEERKRALLARCDAVVFNSDREAFGLVPVEALASGKPVVGINEGFTPHQIVDGENGILFDRGRQSFLAAIEEMYNREWDPKMIQASAEPYDVERFHRQWRQLLYDEEDKT